MYDPNRKVKLNTGIVNNVDIDPALNDYPIGKESKSEIYVCEALTDKGMTIVFVRQRVNGVPVDYDIRIRINPRRLLGDDTYVGILDIRRIDEMLNAIYLAFDCIGIGHLLLDYFRLHEIDMCRNVFFGSQALAEIYLELLKKCFVPSGYSWNVIDGVEFGIKLKDGIRIENGSVAIVAYNKKAQMEKQKKGYFSPVHIEEAEGLIRFEIKLFADRIRNLCRKDNTLYNLHEFFRCCETLSKQHFEKYIPKVFMRGNYFTLEDARVAIKKSGYKEPVKKKMLMLVNRISIHQNFMTALDEVVRIYNPRKPYEFTRDLIQRFDNIYLNPVTVPRRKIEPGEMFLPSAYNQVMGIDTLYISNVD